MEKHLFLTGPTGIGKTSLLRRALCEKLAFSGGLITEAVYGSYGELIGFALAPAAASGNVAGFDAQLVLDCRRFPPHTDNEVYRITGVRLLEEAPWYPYALLDEFGGFELIIPQFREALMSLLRSDLPIIGALKTEEEADAMRQALGLGDKYQLHSHEIRSFLSQDPNTRILDLSVLDMETAARMIQEWIEQYIL